VHGRNGSELALFDKVAQHFAFFRRPGDCIFRIIIGGGAYKFLFFEFCTPAIPLPLSTDGRMLASVAVRLPSLASSHSALHRAALAMAKHDNEFGAG
jgi:hypothetical protein